MENLEIKVSRKTRMVDLPRQFISVDGENLQSKLIFSFTDEFVNGQARLEYKIKGNKNYIVLDKENNAYTLPIKNVITKEGQIDMQLVITEGTDDDNIPVFKSNMFYLFCNSSINAVSEAPDGYELWIEQANAKLNKVDKIANIIKTDGNGTKYLSDDGTYKVVQGGGSGGGTITDVQVDGVSVVTGSVANINLRERVIDILIEYDLLRLDELTEEQIQALNDMTCEINENGELVISYDEEILPISFALESVNLVVTSNINALFGINTNGELEVSYEGN